MRRFFKKLLVVQFLFSFTFTAYTPIFFLPVAAARNVAAAEGQAECVAEVNSRRVLYEKNGDVRLPMASTTKIATAITVLESSVPLDREIEIPDRAIGVEGSSVYLQKGEIYSIKDLLYGLMLRSGNDCATALAIYCGGDEGNFSSMMNETAQKAGALHSRFANPHGLPQDGHYTTARDLALLTCYAMHNATFREIVATRYYKPRNWANKNKMLQICEGGIGVKTGYTKQAGRCLVSAVERNGMTLVSTLLNCSTTYERSCELLEDAFSRYSYEKLVDGTQVLEIESGKEKIQAVTKQDFYYPILEEEKQWLKSRVIPCEKRTNSVQKEKIIGQFELYLAKQLLFSANLYKL